MFNNVGHVALLMRSRGADQGLWGLPGGRLRIKETFRRAIGRELREELGITILKCTQIGIAEDIRPESHWVSALFLVEEAKGSASNRLPTVHAALSWFALDRLPSNITYPTSRAAALIRERSIHG